jgi:V-type H+-transporting ATPase subunit C
MVYWVVGVPTEGNASQTANKLVRGVQGLVHNNSPRVFQVPELKIGTMDTLMAMSDDLAKYDLQVEQIVKKLFRSFYDLQKTKPDDESKREPGVRAPTASAPLELLVDQKDTPNQYLDTFTWNDRRFPPHAALRDLSDMMMKDTLKADDELKQYLSSYNEVRLVLEGMDRKEGGSLLVKPLTTIVDPKYLIDTEHLTTLLLVIPKKEDKIFLAKYETMEIAYAKKEEEREAKMKKDKEDSAARAAENKKPEAETDTDKGEKAEATLDKQALAERAEAAAAAAAVEKERLDHEERMARLPKCNNVVPQSARKMGEDDEFMLYSIVVFKKGLELLKNVCRQERYTIRAHQFDPGEEARSKETRKKLTAERKKKYVNAVATTKSSFSDTFMIWIHIKAMRVFVEVVLRFGLPVNFQSFLIRPKKGTDKRLRESLGAMYKHLAKAESNAKKGEDDEATLSQFGQFFPYVYFEVDLSFEDEAAVAMHM